MRAFLALAVALVVALSSASASAQTVDWERVAIQSAREGDHEAAVGFAYIALAKERPPSLLELIAREQSALGNWLAAKDAAKECADEDGPEALLRRCEALEKTATDHLGFVFVRAPTPTPPGFHIELDGRQIEEGTSGWGGEVASGEVRVTAGAVNGWELRQYVWVDEQDMAVLDIELPVLAPSPQPVVSAHSDSRGAPHSISDVSDTGSSESVVSPGLFERIDATLDAQPEAVKIFVGLFFFILLFGIIPTLGDSNHEGMPKPRWEPEPFIDTLRDETPALVQLTAQANKGVSRAIFGAAEVVLSKLTLGRVHIGVNTRYIEQQIEDTALKVGEAAALKLARDQLVDRAADRLRHDEEERHRSHHRGVKTTAMWDDFSGGL
jgi:hypothetical protein